MTVKVPVPEEVLAVMVVVPSPTIWATPELELMEITPALLELHVAVTVLPFTEAV